MQAVIGWGLHTTAQRLMPRNVLTTAEIRKYRQRAGSLCFMMIFFQKHLLSCGCSDIRTCDSEVLVALTHNIHVGYHFVTFIFIRVKESAFLEQRKEACDPGIKLTTLLSVEGQCRCWTKFQVFQSPRICFPMTLHIKFHLIVSSYFSESTVIKCLHSDLLNYAKIAFLLAAW